MWLVRDVINPPCDENEENIPFMDYLYANVLKPTGQKVIDDIVNVIRTLFPQPLLGKSLPPPSDYTNCNIDMEENIDEDFIEHLREIIDGEEGIKASIQPKRGFYKHSKLTGSDLAKLAVSYIEAINRGLVPSLESSLKSVVRLKLVEEVMSLVDSYHKAMETQLESKLPMEESVNDTNCNNPTLMALHSTIFHEKKMVLCKKIQQVLPKPSQGEPCAEESEVGKSIIAEFERIIAQREDGEVKSGLLFQFMIKNFRESEKHCEELWENLLTSYDIIGMSSQALRHYRADICREVCQRIKVLREEYNAYAIGPARGRVFICKNKDLEDTDKLMCTIPGPPVNVAVVGKAKDKIKLQWKRPEINPEAAKKYIVKYRTGTGRWEEKVTNEQWYIVTGLRSNTRYEVIAASFNDEAMRAREEIDRMSRGFRVQTQSRWLLHAAEGDFEECYVP